MRTKTVQRHYCDHCGKGMFQRPAMRLHEASCFKNPNRSECRICKGDSQTGVTHPRELSAAYANGLDALREAAGGCPGCMMVGCITYEAEHPWDYSGSLPDPEPVQPIRIEFDYKAEKEAWNQERAREFRDLVGGGC